MKHYGKYHHLIDSLSIHSQLPSTSEWPWVRNCVLELRRTENKECEWRRSVVEDAKWSHVVVCFGSGTRWLKSCRWNFSEKYEAVYVEPSEQAKLLHRDLDWDDLPLEFLRPASTEVFDYNLVQTVTIRNGHAFQDVYLGDEVISFHDLDKLKRDRFSQSNTHRVKWKAFLDLWQRTKQQQHIRVEFPNAAVWSSWLAAESYKASEEKWRDNRTALVEKSNRMALLANRLEANLRDQLGNAGVDKPSPTFFKMHGAIERIRETAA